MLSDSLTLQTIPAIPFIEPGDDLAAILIGALEAAGIALQRQDILVIAQKIVSKAEGLYVDLNTITPTSRAMELAQATGKDPRLVEVILSESQEVVRHRKDVLIVAHRLGFVMANGGIDQSNIKHATEGDRALLIPRDPDGTCSALKSRLDLHFRTSIGVIINDSFGRAWRNGVVGVALGAAGLPSLLDLVGQIDMFGRRLRVTQVGFADEIAAAASIVMGQAQEGLPAVLVRGLRWTAPDAPARALLRPKSQDLFR